MRNASEGYLSPCADLDRRQMTDEQERMTDQEFVDRAVLIRIRHGETNYSDYLYMVGRLNYNLNDLEK